MNTGENEQGLRKIVDMTRLISIVVLLIHFYYSCYGLFQALGLKSNFSDSFLKNITHTGLLDSFHRPKYIALLFLLISLMGTKGRKSEKYSLKNAMILIVAGVFLYFISGFSMLLDGNIYVQAYSYISVTTIGYVLVLTGGGNLTRIIKGNLSKEVFNTSNESFPQQEERIAGKYTYNIPTEYTFRNQKRKGWINIPARRALLVLGNPGSGKSVAFVEPIIKQQIGMTWTQFCFDWKFPELSQVAYNAYLKHYKDYKVKPAFCYLSFADPKYTMRCNPIYAPFMTDVTDAIEASRTILLSMNKSWAKRQGEFFVESPMNLLAAIFWFLRKYQGGEYCTVPHSIELLNQPYERLFTVLQTEPEVQSLINSFIGFYKNGVFETLDSQVASAKIPLSRLSSPLLYWVMSGNDFTLDLNNPNAPKIFCLGTDPKRAEALSPIISLYVDRMVKIVNQKGKNPLGIVIDEAATLRADSLQVAISTGRSHNLSCVLALQDLNQLEKVYSREEARTIFNMVGSLAVGQVAGETAKTVSERFHRTFQDRQSMTINSNDTSISKSRQLEAAVTPSTISSLSSCEFVGMVADEPEMPVSLKAFYGKAKVDFEALSIEKQWYLPIPQNAHAGDRMLAVNFEQVKYETDEICESIMERVLNDPAMAHCLVRKQ